MRDWRLTDVKHMTEIGGLFSSTIFLFRAAFFFTPRVQKYWGCVASYVLHRLFSLQESHYYASLEQQTARS
jgi:hypothetical protein